MEIAPQKCINSRLFLIDRFLQLDSWSKFHHPFRWNFKGASSLRIAPIARLTLRNREGAKANQRYASALLERAGGRIDDCVNCAIRRCLRDALCCRDFLDQVPLIHESLLVQVLPVCEGSINVRSEADV